MKDPDPIVRNEQRNVIDFVLGLLEMLEKPSSDDLVDIAFLRECRDQLFWLRTSLGLDEEECE